MNHSSIERIQAASSPRIEGPLNVYFVSSVLASVAVAPGRLAYAVALVCFVGLGIDAAGREYLQVVRLPIYFLLPSVGIVLLFTGGTTAVSVGPIGIAWAGIERSLTTGLRSIGSVAVLGYLIVTTTVPQLFAALRSLRLPGFVVEISLLTYRAIQILLDELSRLELAAAARLGFRTRRTSLETSKAMAFSLFLKSMSRGRTLNEAMLSRGYDGRMPTPSTTNRGYGYVAGVLGVVAFAGWIV